MKKIKIIVFMIIVIIIIFTILGILYSRQEVKLLINDQEIILNRKASQEISLTSFTSEQDAIISKIETNGCQVKINGKKLDDNINLGKIEINKENQIIIEIQYNLFERISYKVHVLDQEFPEYEVTGQSNYEGDYYSTTFDRQKPFYVFKLNNKGNIIYYKKVPSISMDFKKTVLENGQIRYSYLEVVHDGMKQSNNSYYPAKLVIMNEEYQVIDEIKYQLENGQFQELENHDAMILEDGHYILSTYEETKVDNIPDNLTSIKEKIGVTNNKLQEVRNGEILWSFQTIDYPELYGCLDTATTFIDYYNRNTKYADYAHFNSCAIDPNDGNLVCSFRNLDALLKINRENGKLMWILGGKKDQFNLSKTQKFAKQHNISFLPDGSIMIFDNSNSPNKSRIVKMKLDEKNKKLTSYESYDLPVVSSAMGSVQELDKDIYLICYGQGKFKEDVVQEINTKTKEVYFSFRFVDANYLYNVYKIK